MFLTANYKSPSGKIAIVLEGLVTHKFESKINAKTHAVSEDFVIDVSVATQDSIKIIVKLKLLDFNLICEQNEIIRVKQNSQPTLDLAFANAPCITKINEHAITDLLV